MRERRNKKRTSIQSPLKTDLTEKLFLFFSLFLSYLVLRSLSVIFANLSLPHCHSSLYRKIPIKHGSLNVGRKFRDASPQIFFLFKMIKAKNDEIKPGTRKSQSQTNIFSLHKSTCG